MSKRFLLPFAFILVIGVVALSYHDQTKVDQKVKDIQTADASGKPTTAAIIALKSYAAGHMGTGAKFTLTGQYNRDVAAARAVAQIQAENSQIYAQAQQACAGHANSIAQAECNAAYLQKHLVLVPASAPLTAPKLADYSYNFRAPVWTPSMAGASWVGA